MIPDFLKGKTIAVWDLEADLIPSTVIHCNSISIIKDGVVLAPAEVYTQYWTPYSNGSLMESITRINRCDYYCGHNIVGFDVPLVMRLMNVRITPKPLDTLILAKIIFSKDDLFAMDPHLGIEKTLYGGYSLKAFGQRLGDFKLDFNDFSALTAEMATYCDQDVDLTARLLLFLMGKDNFPTEAVIDIEHKAAAIIAEQADNGFYLDIERTRALNTKLLAEKFELHAKLAEIFSPKMLKDGQVKHYKKTSVVKKYLPNPGYRKVW